MARPPGGTDHARDADGSRSSGRKLTRMSPRRYLVAAALGLQLVTARPAAAQLQWDPHWRKVDATELAAAAAMGGSVGVTYLHDGELPARGGGVLFDDGVRGALRATSREGRLLAQRAGTATYWSLVAFPLLDGAVTPSIRGRSDIASQLTIINLESFAFTGFVFRVTEAAFRRARPYESDCLRHGSPATCRGPGSVGSTNSFISGHTAIAVTGAALACTHHAHLSLYGNGTADGATCAVAVAAASFTAVARLVSDDHYATDLVGGVALGVLSGWALPTLLHYGFDGRTSSGTLRTWTVAPGASDTALGGSFFAAF
jgi:membrane-associated phospholipid phosphatase